MEDKKKSIILYNSNKLNLDINKNDTIFKQDELSFPYDNIYETPEDLLNHFSDTFKDSNIKSIFFLTNIKEIYYKILKTVKNDILYKVKKLDNNKKIILLKDSNNIILSVDNLDKSLNFLDKKSIKNISIKLVENDNDRNAPLIKYIINIFFENNDEKIHEQNDDEIKALNNNVVIYLIFDEKKIFLNVNSLYNTPSKLIAQVSNKETTESSSSSSDSTKNINKTFTLDNMYNITTLDKNTIDEITLNMSEEEKKRLTTTYLEPPHVIDNDKLDDLEPRVIDNNKSSEPHVIDNNKSSEPRVINNDKLDDLSSSSSDDDTTLSRKKNVLNSIINKFKTCTENDNNVRQNVFYDINNEIKKLKFDKTPPLFDNIEYGITIIKTWDKSYMISFPKIINDNFFIELETFYVMKHIYYNAIKKLYMKILDKDFIINKSYINTEKRNEINTFLIEKTKIKDIRISLEFNKLIELLFEKNIKMINLNKLYLYYIIYNDTTNKQFYNLTKNVVIKNFRYYHKMTTYIFRLEEIHDTKYVLNKLNKKNKMVLKEFIEKIINKDKFLLNFINNEKINLNPFIYIKNFYPNINLDLDHKIYNKLIKKYDLYQKYFSIDHRGPQSTETEKVSKYFSIDNITKEHIKINNGDVKLTLSDTYDEIEQKTKYYVININKVINIKPIAGNIIDDFNLKNSLNLFFNYNTKIINDFWNTSNLLYIRNFNFSLVMESYKNIISMKT